MNNRVKIRLKVRNQNYFLKDLLQRKIELLWITQTKEYLEIIVKEEDYEKIQKMKTIESLKIIDYYGISKVKKVFKKYGYSLLLIGIGILLNIVLSNLIFQVDVQTPSKTLQKRIQTDLEKLGIKKYHWKVSSNEKETIKEKIFQMEKNHLEWIEIEEKGTKYIVKVEEKKLTVQEKCPMRNIVSRKKAILTKIEASSGEVTRKINDYVEAGEVVISGLIHNKDKVVSKRCAKGIIYGETWYKVTVSIPKKKIKVEKTNQKTWGVFLNILEKEYIYPLKYKTYEKTEYNIMKSKIMPLGVGIIKEEETTKKIENYTNSMIEKKALKEAREKLKEYMKEQPMVLRKKVLKKTTKNSKIIVEVFFAVEEDITSYQDITKIEIEELNKEKE